MILMQEIITAISSNITPTMVSGNAALALALIPAQYLVDIGKARISDFVEKVLPYQPEKVFYDAFLKSLQEHKKWHDYVAGSLVNKLIQQIEKDKKRFYNCINDLQVPKVLAQSSEPFPAHLFADKLFSEYELNMYDEELLTAIIRDCMAYYRRNLYRLMDEKGLLLQALQTLMDLQDRAAIFETILTNAATKSDVMILKDAILTAIHREDSSAWWPRTLADYDQMIEGQYCYIEFTAGFSPRINARDIRMKMSDVFINLECAYQRPADSSLSKFDFDLTSAVLHNRYNVFLGDPGCGKTTLLKKIAFDLSSPQNRTDGILSNFIPLYFRLADYSRFYQENHKGLIEYLQQRFYQFRDSLFKTAQREQSLVFLMDGLDEIADTPLRIQVVEQVNTFVFANPQYIYFITSRIVGYQDAALNGIFSTYRLEPLTDAKIETFVYQWHLAVEENTEDGKSAKDKKTTANKNTQSLVNAIEKNSSVKRLATNPLLLTIITLIHLQGGRLPNKRVELYNICADTFLQHWINRRVENASAILDRDVLIELLSRVAFYIHEKYDNGLIPEDDFKQKFLQYYQELSGYQANALPELKKECHRFIDFIRQETGIFSEKGQDEEGKNLFGFLHLTFEEYFAAIEFKRRVAQNILRLKSYIYSARWREIILLCAALFGGQSGNGRYEASLFVSKIMRVKEIFPPMRQNLRLVLSIMTDDVRITAECEKDIWRQLESALQADLNFNLYTELEALNTSIVYRGTLYTKAKQWLTGKGQIFVNTVNLVFKLCRDSILYDRSQIWYELLAEILDYPDFSSVLDQLYIPYYYIQQFKDITPKLADKIIGYLNKHSQFDRIKCNHLFGLALIGSEQLGEKLTSYKDQLALLSFCLANKIPNIINENYTDFSGELRHLIDKVTFCAVPQLNIIIHQEIPILGTTMASSFWDCGMETACEVLPYHHLVVIRKQANSQQHLFQHIVLDFSLQEIQINTCDSLLSEENFLKIFGFHERGINVNNLQWYDMSCWTPSSNLEKLSQSWEDGNLQLYNRFMNIELFPMETQHAYLACIRQWMQSHGQDAPVQLLLAQIILNKYDHQKNSITRKALQDAVSYYMHDLIPENLRQYAYRIITTAIRMQKT